MNKSTHPLVIILLLVVGCNQNSGKQETADANSTSETIQPQYELEWTSELLLDTSEHYRGLVLLDDIAYAAGSNGQVFRISIQNTSAQLLMSIPGRHFRDIDLINDSTALALAITEPAEIIRFNLNYPEKNTTTKGLDSLSFWDGISFWDDKVGLMIGDPQEGSSTLFKTVDAGKTWTPIPSKEIPAEALNYAGFAASGSSISCLPNGIALIGLGNETGKILRTTDYGKTWDWISFPYLHQAGGSGVYSIAASQDGSFISAVGGNWQTPDSDSSKIYSLDKGISWHLSSGVQAYRSCVYYFKDNIFIATGTSGTDISYDGGQSWTTLDTIGFNAIAITQKGLGIAVGNRGETKTFKLKLIQ